ncbi:hypothetical protein OAL61_04040 [Candidatus Pelagibacter sp.]|nr:hypothetical protein [Candidatus Pelagibacter sp.]
MKNAKPYIIGISIIIGSLIISFIISKSTIFNKNYSAKEHCYKKNYTYELQKNKDTNKLLNDDVKQSIEYMEADAAETAIYTCKLQR